MTCVTTKTRDTVNRPLRASNLCLHARQTTQRNIEGDFGLPVSEPVDITQLRPRLRHGARMIGIDPPQVKAACPLSCCFS